MITDKKLFHFEVTVTDQQRVKRRLIFYGSQAYSYQKDNIMIQPLHARIPCEQILERVWMNLQFDIQGFINQCFGPIGYTSIDSIVLQGPCRIRKILACRHQIPDYFSLWIEQEYGDEIAAEYDDQCNSSSSITIEELPQNLNFPLGIEYLNQVISFERLQNWAFILEQVGIENSNNGNQQKSTKPKPHIAFGSRFANKPILENQQQIQNALNQIDKVKKLYSPQKIIQGGINEGVITQSPEQRFRIKQLQLQHNSEGDKFQKKTHSQIYEQIEYNSNLQDGTSNTFQQSVLQMKEQRHSSESSKKLQNYSQLPMQIQRNLSAQKFEEQQLQTTEFDQYNLTPSLQNQKQFSKEYSLPQIKSKQQSRIGYRVMNVKNGQLGGNNGQGGLQYLNDDQILNEKLRYLEQMRQVVNNIASKYQLENNSKVSELKLLTIYQPFHKDHHHMHATNDPNSVIFSSDPKDRIKEYHEKVNQKNRKTYLKNLAKKQKQQQDQETNKDNKEQNDGSPQSKNKKQDKEVQETKQNGEQNVEGWEGDNQDDEEDEGEGNKKVNNDKGNKKQKDNKKKGEDGEEEDYGNEEEGGEDEYGNEGGEDYGKEEEEGGDEEDY